MGDPHFIDDYLRLIDSMAAERPATSPHHIDLPNLREIANSTSAFHDDQLQSGTNFNGECDKLSKEDTTKQNKEEVKHNVLPDENFPDKSVNQQNEVNLVIDEG